MCRLFNPNTNNHSSYPENNSNKKITEINYIDLKKNDEETKNPLDLFKKNVIQSHNKKMKENSLLKDGKSMRMYYEEILNLQDKELNCNGETLLRENVGIKKHKENEDDLVLDYYYFDDSFQDDIESSDFSDHLWYKMESFHYHPDQEYDDDDPYSDDPDSNAEDNPYNSYPDSIPSDEDEERFDSDDECDNDYY